MQWHHVVATIFGTAGNVYFDGNLDGSGDVGSIPKNTLDIFIGLGKASSRSSFLSPFNGMIDDVRIYNLALSSNDVQQLYAYESQPIVALKKAVKPSFSNLYSGTNYQLQVSTDAVNWTNQGAAFTPTNSVMDYPQYFDVDNWSELFFRLQTSP